MDENGTPNGLSVVLKDIWIDSDRTREGNILAQLLDAAKEEDKPLVKRYFLTVLLHGDVWTGPGRLDDTTNGLMRGLTVPTGHDSQFILQRKPFNLNYETSTGSKSLDTNRLPASHSHPIYAHKTHYRIVFKEQGTTIDCVKSLHEVMTVLTETAEGAF